MTIGDWVQREKRGVPHLVESIVSGDVVTKCGKRMRDEPNSNGGLKLSGPTQPRCKVCDEDVRLHSILKETADRHADDDWESFTPI